MATSGNCSTKSTCAAAGIDYFDYFDYYEALGVSESASLEDIRKAYKQQALRWHPDKAPPEGKEAATERFKAVCAAYDVLSEDSKRNEYDRRRTAASNSGGAMPGHNVSLKDAWEIFIRFTIAATARQFELSRDGPMRVVRLMGTMGIAVTLSVAGGTTGGLAISAVTAALLNADGALSVYRGLSNEEKVAFCQAVVMLATSIANADP